MKFRRFLVLVVVLVATLAAAEAGHRLRSRSRKDGSSLRGPHHRSKRTLGNIINWKLNLLQQIFGGITGLFGGGKKKPRPGYGAPGRRPNRPNRPRPGGPRPGYGPPKGRPQRPQRPSYGGGGGRPQSNGGGSFGPSNAIYMLPAPNLATAAPQVRHPIGPKILTNQKTEFWFL